MSRSEESVLDEILSEKKPLKFERGGIYGIEFDGCLSAGQREAFRQMFDGISKAHGVHFIVLDGGAKFATT